MTYPLLFQKGYIGKVEIKNRIVYGSNGCWQTHRLYGKYVTNALSHSNVKFFLFLFVAPFGTFLKRTLLSYIAGMTKPFQVSLPNALVHFRNYLSTLLDWIQKLRLM